MRLPLVVLGLVAAGCGRPGSVPLPDGGFGPIGYYCADETIHLVCSEGCVAAGREQVFAGDVCATHGGMYGGPGRVARVNWDRDVEMSWADTCALFPDC